jgi:hypothetical protein
MDRDERQIESGEYGEILDIIGQSSVGAPGPARRGVSSGTCHPTHGGSSAQAACLRLRAGRPDLGGFPGSGTTDGHPFDRLADARDDADQLS